MFDKILGVEEQAHTAEDDEWDAFVAAHPQGSLLQTTGWARLKNRFGWRSHRVWLKRDGRIVAGAQLLYKSAALGLMKMAYIPHGPLVDWADAEQTAVLLNQIDRSVYERRAAIVKMEPLLWQDAMPPATWQAICQQHELRPETDTIQPPQTVLVDLRPSLDDILAAMKQKTRYNIRLATKKGVTTRQGTRSDLPAFVHLMQTTGQRDGFGIHTPLYYQAAYEIFAETGQVALWLAECEARPLAAIMVFTLGHNAYYLYGASSNEERERMPNYAVQWAAIEWAKNQGCQTYDLWGIPDAPEAELEANFTNRHDGLWGVYRFKRGFGGEIKRTVGATDRVYNDLAYKLYQWRRSR
ncbi:MAG TPA: peptidoglycan bridge formation glycyltransferase FemA/FemB family protein [Chloroflexota bacterium]|nr:peptidoglycan bridge formation glycyltransferase FemA/FemB family protein [Chloroflexota bacterium]HUM72100.1 peptidoglycan bridge formation glycyltransferase FemA/FemB family protein [Chloroflexota bacterium]